MKRKQFLKYILLAGVLMAMLHSCSKNEDSCLKADKIVFGASVQTKAGDFSFETGDRIGVFADYEDNGTTVEFLENAEFTYSLDKFTGEYWYEKEDYLYDFFAYYPFAEGIVIDAFGETEYNAETEQNLLEKFEKADLMLAAVSGHANDGTDPQLQFRHAMSLVNVSIKGLPYDGSEGTLAVTGVAVSGTLSSSSLALTASDDQSATVNACFSGKSDSGEQSFSCYLIPQKVPAGNSLFEFSHDGKTYTYTLQADVEFLAGSRHTFELNIAGAE